MQAIQESIQSTTILSPNASRLYRIRKTVATMLRKRGFVVPENILNQKPEDFKAEFCHGGDSEPSRDQLSLLCLDSNQEDKIYVFFPEGDLGMAQIKLCVFAAVCALEVGFTPFSSLPPPPPLRFLA